MITVAKRELKARMPAYFRLVEQNGEELTVTDRGRPVLSITSLQKSVSVENAFGDLRKKAKHPSEKTLLAPLTAEWPEV